MDVYWSPLNWGWHFNRTKYAYYLAVGHLVVNVRRRQS